jgi:hypothetical protein
MPAPVFQPILQNPGFETGDLTGWDVTSVGGTGSPSSSDERPYSGQYSGRWLGGSGTGHAGGIEGIWINTARAAMSPGQSLQVQARIALKDTDSSQNRGEVRIYWYDDTGAQVGSPVSGNLIRGNSSSYKLSSVTGSAPSGATFAALGVYTSANSSGGVLIDDVSWNYQYDQSVELLTPADGATYATGDVIPLRVRINGTTPAPTSVTYKADAATIGASAVAPFDFNNDDLAAGTYDITAVVTFADNTTLTTTAHEITVTDTPTPPDTREYKASNSYTYLVAKNFSGLGAAIPSIARVTGTEVIVEYTIRALIRSADIVISDPAGSNSNVAFDITDGADLEATLLVEDGTGFAVAGAPIVQHVELNKTDFTVVETGLSEDKKWTVMDSVPFTVTMGSDTDFFGLQPVAATDFTARSLGFRFLPTLAAKPSYADTGDAVFRIFINKIRLRVYFDAGSAEYYFASPDKTQVIKGNLVSSYVTEGDLETGDAAGVLQLNNELTVMDGTQTWIGDDWTIHAAYPPTNTNQIGEVAEREQEDGVGMSYNGLPSAAEVIENRSRYQFITANFFAVRQLDSIYGAHGLPRAFAYNGDFFYKIHTQPDPDKDQPRHLAYHHGHLALGFDDGRVDVSVIGKPYNFDGALGASEWSIGDKVTGLLPLSGTILGIFGSKSIWGLSGTTVDNFATQVITPNIGAIEYTVTDMGYPVYANAYGVYTLAQTQQYGDYLGTPMSQDISPWLRPRLVRKYTSDQEVVVAWPVRSKNQYRLAFSDGYIMSMTLNAGQQAAPTFSFQQYTIYTPEDE